jgi:hypothetical protein
MKSLGAAQNLKGARCLLIIAELDEKVQQRELGDFRIFYPIIPISLQ